MFCKQLLTFAYLEQFTFIERCILLHVLSKYLKIQIKSYTFIILYSNLFLSFLFSLPYNVSLLLLSCEIMILLHLYFKMHDHRVCFLYSFLILLVFTYCLLLLFFQVFDYLIQLPHYFSTSTVVTYTNLSPLIMLTSFSSFTMLSFCK